MKRYSTPIRSAIVIFLWSFLSAAAPLPAQDATKNDEDPRPLTTQDPDIPVEYLKKLLHAPTEEELAVEAGVWQQLVQAKVAEIAEAEIAGLKAKEDDVELPDSANDSVAKLSQEKTALLERFRLVLDAWERKGGDVSKMSTYASAVSGIDIETKDAGAALAQFKAWLTYEDGGVKWGLRALQFVGIMLVTWLVSRFVGRLVRKATAMNRGISGLLRDFINKTAKRVVLLIGLLVALSTLGVKVGAILALIGGGAFIVGFALQDTLGNFAAGLMLLVYRPFDVGDVVSVGGVTGKVDQVSLVSTKIRTPDNQIILVPNRNVFGQTITNVTGSKERRVDLVFGIAYEDDMETALDVLARITTAHAKVLPDPAPVIRVNELAASSVNIVCRPWAKTEDYWEVYWDLTRQVKQAFDAEGISIPYPQQQIHYKQLPVPGQAK